ncbi:5-oxoprolinase subunit PxpB [Luteitalea sp.]|uniref:5-oxoprolinase subunit PxpB n=1 Tax=Luteitalea sp. TaxID=2004800 RepID=UPI0037CA3392
MSTGWRLAFVGDSALAVRALDDAAVDANARVHALAAAVRAAAIDGVRDVVPGMRDLVVHVDPRRCDIAAVERALTSAEAPMAAPVDAAPVVTIPVHFGGADGPDLQDVAFACGLTADDVVARFTASPCVVHFVGFQPGFPYLGPLDPALRLPRRTTPRPRVPAGSVAIAGEYAGVYPSASPGGWHLIGRTDVAMFDVSRAQPALLAPGMRVQFVDVDG